MSSHTTAIVSITACLVHAPKTYTQSGNFQFDIKAPSDFKILSAPKLKTLFQKYKLELVLSCEGIANLTFSSPPHLKLPIIYDTL